LPIEVITEPDVEIEPDLSYQDYPSKVLDCKERSTRARSIKMYKIQWINHLEEDATWETENFCAQTTPIVYLRKSVCNHTPAPLPFESKYKKGDLNINRVKL
jgi:hypothetical protein